MKYRLFVAIAIIAMAIFARLLYLSQAANESKTSEVAADNVPTASITTNDLLTATDVKQGVMTALEQNKPELIDDWVEQMVSVAEVANLPARDIKYLRSPAAREYLIFNAKRALFHQEFEARYYALQDVSDLAEQYPQARDLLIKAETLIEKRDSIIYSIAVALAGEQTPSDEHIERAKILWQERYQSNNH